MVKTTKHPLAEYTITVREMHMLCLPGISIILLRDAIIFMIFARST
jgi:hypothetical protein